MEIKEKTIKIESEDIINTNEVNNKTKSIPSALLTALVISAIGLNFAVSNTLTKK